jgi:hypothetical protein
VIVPIIALIMLCLLGLGFAKLAAVAMWIVLPIVQGVVWLVSRAFLQPWEIVAEPAGLEREAVRWRGDGGLITRRLAGVAEPGPLIRRRRRRRLPRRRRRGAW